MAGAFTVLLVAYGSQYAYGVFFAALLDAFGWSRAELSGVFSLYALTYCLAAFPAGRLTDRFGPRAVIATGGCLLGGALMAMALVSRLWHPYVIYGLVAALGMGTAYVPSSATITRWFVRRRGLAVGLAAIGQSVGTLAGPPAAQALVATSGWQSAYLVFGAAVVIALSVVSLFMRRSPEDMGQHPDGDRAPAAAAPGDGWTLSLAMRTRPFWLLTAVFVISWIPIFMPFVHLVRFAQDLGMTAMDGAGALAAVGVGALVARILIAALADRLSRQALLAACMVVQAVAFFGFMAVGTRPGLYAAAALFGFSYGPISTLFAAIVTDFFGRAHAGALIGVFFAIAGSATAIGPLAAGLIHDVLHTYDPAFVGSALLNLGAAVLLAICQPPGAVRPTAEPREKRPGS